MNLRATTPSVMSRTKGSQQAKAIVGGNSVYAHIVDDSKLDECNFWLGLFQPGTKSPVDLWSARSILELFDEAASTGISEKGPVMMSDSEMTPARFVYLLPPPPAEERSDWLKQIVNTLRTWSPKRVGIYISPKMIDHHSCAQLLQQIVEELILNTSTKDYDIVPGRHGTNTILNALLALKVKFDEASSEAKDPSKLKKQLFIFH